VTHVVWARFYGKPDGRAQISVIGDRFISNDPRDCDLYIDIDIFSDTATIFCDRYLLFWHYITLFLFHISVPGTMGAETGGTLLRTRDPQVGVLL